MKILVIGVVYKEIENYLHDYFHSLKIQETQDFDLLIIEDGIKLGDFNYSNKIFLIQNNKGFNPAQLRFEAIEFAKKKKYDYLVFSDCDDFFSGNRIQRTVDSLKHFDIYLNKLVLVDCLSRIISREDYFTFPNNIEMEDLFRMNYFGLSNTGIRLSSLPEKFYIPSDIIAVDWWIFSLLLLSNKSCFYDNSVTTFYRQHVSNMVGMGSLLDKTRLSQGIDVKLSHYKNLSKYCQQNNLKQYALDFYNLYVEFESLKVKLSDDVFIQEYLIVVNRNLNKIRSGWWSEILSLKEWRKYE